MRLIYEPVIHRAWATAETLSPELLEYLDPWVPNDEVEYLDEIPEIAGRICYQSFSKPRPGGNEAYLKRILSEGHGSVLAHSSIGFIIHGVSRSLTHELIRHSVGAAISELSQRFVDASELGFVVSPKWILAKGGGKVIASIPKSFRKSVEEAVESYKSLSDELNSLASTTLERKRIREAARSVLPNCTETHIAYTNNIRGWRNIVEQRANIDADLEIRRLAVAIARKLKTLAPNAFQDFEVFEDEDGRESVRYEWRKV